MEHPLDDGDVADDDELVGLVDGDGALARGRLRVDAGDLERVGAPRARSRTSASAAPSPGAALRHPSGPATAGTP